MPSLPALLSPTGPAPRPYSPLHNPGEEAAIPSRPSSTTRVASSSSTGSSDSESRITTTPSRATGYTSITRATTNPSDETLGNRMMNGNGIGLGYGGEEGDIGELKRSGSGASYGYKGGKADFKGKGREQPWDVEQGKVEEMYAGTGQYPPTNDEEEEEKRIQDNLARMAAREQARRRASRQPKMVIATASPDLGAEGYSSSTSYGRPMSVLSMGNKRSSFMGLVDGLWGSGHRTPAAPIEEEHEPPFIPPDMPRDSAQLMANPYATRPAPVSPTLNQTPPPGLVISPASPDVEPRVNPFDDPTTPRGSKAPNRNSNHPNPPGHQRTDSTASTIQATSPTSPLSPSSSTSPTETMRYGYAGPGWRGGSSANAQVVEKPEKWWHAFCAWGRDLDGDDEDGENQAGRTNPFE